MRLQLVQNIFEQQSYNCSNNSFNNIVINDLNIDDGDSNCSINNDDNNIITNINININNNINGKTVFRSRLAIKYSLTNGIGLSDRFLVILSQPNTGACHRLVVPDGSS